MYLPKLLCLAAVGVRVGGAIPLLHDEVQQRDLQKRSVSPFYYDTTEKAINAMGQSYSTSSHLWTDITGWAAGVAYMDIMDNDHYTGQAVWKLQYSGGLLAIANSPSLQDSTGFSSTFNDDRLWWVLAMLRAWQNYHGGDFSHPLYTTALASYHTVRDRARILGSAAGTTPSGRSYQIPSTCDVDGVVYWNQDPTSGFTAISTSLFAKASAWLYEFTGNPGFLDAADWSLGWIERNVLGSNGIAIVDNVRANDCSKHPGSLTYNTGVYIGALCALYRRTGQQIYLDRLNATATTAVLGYFHSPSDTSSPPLIVDESRGLTTSGDWVPWRDVLFRNLLDLYVTIQSKNTYPILQGRIVAFFQANYNWIHLHAKPREDQDLYTAEWFGAITTGSDWGTGSVLGVLNGATMMLTHS